MNTLLVVVVGLVLVFLSSTLISILFSLVTAFAYSLGAKIKPIVGIVLGTLVLSGIALVWTALLYLVADKLSTSEFAVSWIIWSIAIVAAIMPIGKAGESAQREAKVRKLTVDQDNLGWCFGIASKVQIVAMIVMFFSERALDWWR